MKLIIVKIILLSFLCLPSVLSADLNEESNILPENIVVEYKNEKFNLTRTGLTIRKKFFLKIYSMTHYVEKKPDSSFKEEEIYKAILHQSSTRQISMVFLRSLKAKQIQESLISGLKLNTNEREYTEMMPQIETFMHAIYEDVEENDEFVLRWLPDGTMLSLFKGKEISSIKDENFARTLWSIWFGDYSVVDRKMLIKELLTSS
ncbi:MAG: hypothetical protein HND53_08650 [Proteobacteria bacterium]|nr:hypothetical protein [Pseudomonadota bacterium]NOG60552.1 hypothetical protein [Pseudomonadota bacterium]